MKAQERRDREIWQGGQLSFIKSIRYEPQSVSPGDVVWFVFFSPHHTLTQRHTHTHLLIYSELSVEAKAVNLEQTSKKQSYWAFWYIKVIVYLAHNPKLIELNTWINLRLWCKLKGENALVSIANVSFWYQFPRINISLPLTLLSKDFKATEWHVVFSKVSSEQSCNC